MINRTDIQEGIDKLFVNYRVEIEEEKIKDMITLWHEEFKKWTPNDFQTVTAHIISNNKTMPRIANMWAAYFELELGIKSEKWRAGFYCESCKDSGVRAYEEDGIVCMASCECNCGGAIKRSNPAIPIITDKLEEPGIREYPIHKPNQAFGGYIPKGQEFRLSQEICGKDSFMYEILENVKLGKINVQDATQEFTRGLKPMQTEKEEDELPF